MNVAQLTEERLRSWLDANQVQRERMCIALLALSPGYSRVKPRRPKGGPDGARDIEGVYGDRSVVWGAVGFRNSVSDSADDKDWVKKKFRLDLDAALAENRQLVDFVFFTNVDLTPGEIARLQQYANSKGIQHLEIFYRERLRILLDSPEGLGFRYQYLGIPLSEAEQAAFFAKWGNQLETVILEGFSTIDTRLARIEFFHDCNKPLTSVEVIIELRRQVCAEELGHFRALIEVENLFEPDPHPALWVAGRDAYPLWWSENVPIKLIGTQNLVWSRSPDQQIQNTITSMGGPDQATDRLVFSGNVYHGGPYPTLGHFDRQTMSVFVTKPLFDQFARIGFVANEYLLAMAAADELMTWDREPLETWPDELTEAERQVPLVELVAKGDYSTPFPAIRRDVWSLDFSSYTPMKV